MSYTKITLLGLILISGYLGWSYYGSHGVHTPSTVELKGLQAGAGVSGDIQFSVHAYDPSKIASLELLLDGIRLGKHEPQKRSAVIPVTLATKELSQGKHIVTIDLVSADSTRLKSHLEVPFYVDNLPLQATITKNQLDARIYQGRTLHVEFQTNKEIKEASLKTLSLQFPCYLQSQRGTIYECFVPIECEEIAQGYPFSIDLLDWAGNTLQLEGSFTVVAFPFKKQSLKVDMAKIQSENELGLPEKQLEDEVTLATAQSPKKKLWQGKFIMPLDYKESSQITSDFGVIRATQERGLSQHKALDLVAQPRSVVWAPQDGIVVIKGRYAHSGNTVVIDHGYGLLSLFFHLDQFGPSAVGEPIKKGKPLGTVGKTGYATGYHLHWEMRVNGVAVDPFEWTQQTF